MKRLGAECVGTFVLVFGGVGTAVIAGHYVGLVGISFAFGLALLAMAYAVGPISGCHINPAVTLGMALRRKISPPEALGYWAAQVVGAIIAAGVVLLIAKGRPGGYSAGTSGLAANGYGAHSPGRYSLGAGFATEAVLTGFLVFTVLAATDRIADTAFAGLPIGLVLVLVNLVGIPVTNLSVNPARSIGPAVYVGGWALSQLWLFIVAPFVGGAIAAIVHAVLFGGDAKHVPRAESAVAGGGAAQ